VRVDALAVRLRPRTGLEAADLGVRLCQASARSVYACHLLVALPLVALALASFESASWLPSVMIWWTKPWIDRTSLFVLSRAAFGLDTRPADLWLRARQVWWDQLPATLTVRRLSPWRALTQPVYQLEGLSYLRAGARASQIRQRQAGTGFLVTAAFWAAETALSLSLFSLVFWLTPGEPAASLMDLFATDMIRETSRAGTLSYAAAVLFIEPFYVAAGFAMYLNRRAELEAWDLEQEFRRAFSRQPS
jgi:hypothetical protein